MSFVRRSGFMKAAVALTLVAFAGCDDKKAGEDKLPPGAGDPPWSVVTGAGYRFAWGTPDASTALGLADLDPLTRVGRLDLLRKDQAPVAISNATDVNVKVSPDAPSAAMFLEGVGGNAGTLFRADLATGEKVAVPNAARAFVGGYWFGPTSKTVLFIAEPNGDGSRGQLYWSNIERSDEIGAGAVLSTVVITKDRSAAVVGVDVDGAGVGKLVHIDLTSGTPVTIGEDVQVLVGKVSAFSVDASASTVAFTTAGGVVQLWKKGGEASQLAATGSMPGVSADGTTAAWLADGKLLVSQVGGTPLAISGVDGANIAVSAPPTISPDKAYVAWFNNLSTRGGLTGDGYVASTTASAPPVKFGEAVALDSLLFSSKTPRLSAIVGLRRLGGETGDADYAGYGKLVIGAPDQALPRVGEDLRATGGMALLEVSDRVAYIANIVPGAGTGELFISGATAGVEPLKVGTSVRAGSLQASTGGFDRVTYIVLDESLDKRTLEDGTIYGTLYRAALEGQPLLLQEGVVDARISGGRVIAVVGEGENAGVWSLPLGS